MLSDREVSLAQIGPGYIILREPADIEPCDAEISVEVDGDDRRIPVRLVDGVQPFDKMARTEQHECGERDLHSHEV